MPVQVVDDILDFTQSTEQLGKPQVGLWCGTALHCDAHRSCPFSACRHEWENETEGKIESEARGSPYHTPHPRLCAPPPPSAYPLSCTLPPRLQGQDLASGNLTAPVIYALQNPAVADELGSIIGSEFVEEGSLARALHLVAAGGGIEAARRLARREADAALAALECLPEPASAAKRSLQLMVEYVLQRIY
jgi:hypothetical protein